MRCGGGSVRCCEGCGETNHKLPKGFVRLTTRGGAQGRGWKKGTGKGLYLESRKGRVMMGDLNTTHQVFKKVASHLLLKTQEARNWFEIMAEDHPGVPVFEFLLDGPRADVCRGAYPKPYHPPTVTPDRRASCRERVSSPV